MGLFIKPMGEELDIGQTFFGFAQTARLIGFSATSWFIGRHLDRHGARLPLAVAGLITGSSVMAIALITNGWQMVILLFIGGLTGLQGLGGSLYTTDPISRWFVRNRGKALSMAFLGTPIGIFIMPPVTQVLIDGVGWRGAWLIMGGMGTAVVVLVASLIMRRRPEDMGLLPDGVAELSEAEVGADVTQPNRAWEVSWTREEAMRSSAFWRLAAVDGLRMGAMATAGIFRVPYFIDQGIDAQTVAFALSFEAAFAALISIPTGWATDRFDPRFITAASTSAMLLTFIVLLGADTTAEVFLVSALFGLGASSFQVSQGAVWPNYFGVANIGKIRGIALPIGLSLSAISAPLTGMVKDSTGDFFIAWIAAAIALVACTVILLITPKPAPPRRDSVGQGATAKR
jgi:MFS family permease